MRDLDDTDREILRLLLEDARRPYSDIAEAVDLSPPAVSDRVERLRDIGLLERFTVDLDRSMLRAGVPLLLDLAVDPGRGAVVSESLADDESVEYVFRTADDRVLATAVVPPAEADAVLADAVDLDAVDEYHVRLLADTDWSPALGEATLAPDCAECGNTVDAEGTTATLNDEIYHFCCASCEGNFVERYQSLREGA